MILKEETLFIDRMAYGGAGVGRLQDGRVCFVHGTLPGERAVVRITKEKKNLVEADLVRLLEVSPRRIPARCPVYGECGGCGYQHAEYNFQLEIKTAQVIDLLKRIGGIHDVEVLPTLASPEQWGYRNRISVHTDQGQAGFYHRHSHELIDVAWCPIASDEVNQQLEELHKNPPRDARRLTLRESKTARGFTQVNVGAAEILGQVVERFAGSGETLIDAYCGSGFFAKRLTSQFDQILGIEWSEGAIRAAKESATEKESYIAGSVEAHLRNALLNSPPSKTTLILDPPSEGLSPDAMRAILENPPSRIVYVSCDPATFARDAKKLVTNYKISRVQPVDMFPQTAEIELAANFELIHTT